MFGEVRDRTLGRSVRTVGFQATGQMIKGTGQEAQPPPLPPALSHPHASKKHPLLIFEVYDGHRVVAERRADLRSVRVPVDVEDAAAAPEAPDEGSVLDRPDVEDLVERSRGEKVPIRRERDRVNGVRVLSQRVCALARCDVLEKSWSPDDPAVIRMIIRQCELRLLLADRITHGFSFSSRFLYSFISILPRVHCLTCTTARKLTQSLIVESKEPLASKRGFPGLALPCPVGDHRTV